MKLNDAEIISGSEISSALTLRDYFAAKAMHAQLLIRSNTASARARGSICFTAYQMADAMLSERRE